MISSASVLWDTYDGDGTTKNFAITTPVGDYDPNLVLVQVEDSTGAIADAEVGVGPYAYTIHVATKEVRFAQAPVLGETIYIVPDVPLTQLKDFVNGEAMNADNIEGSLDKLTLEIQQINRKAQNHIGLTLPEDGVNMGLPGVDLRAGRIVGCDSEGGFTMMDTMPDTTLVSAWVADNLLDDADAAAVRATINVYSEADVDALVEASNLPTGGTANQVHTKKSGTDYDSDWQDVPYPAGHLFGLETAAAADAEHDVTISVGHCRSYSNAYNMNLTGPITKRIDAAWAAGTNAGGLMFGTVGANTTYHLFLIRNDSDGTLDAGWDISISAANIPSGYTGYRRLRSYVTDASSNIIDTFQLGDEFILKSKVRDHLATGTVPNTQTNITLASIPIGLNFVAKITTSAYDNTTGRHVNIGPSDSIIPLPADRDAVYQISPGATNTIAIGIMTNTSAQIAHRWSATTVGWFAIFSIGWIDTRGKFGGA
jgi:hypothetical protein